MTDARFLSNNSVTIDANHLKCKILMRCIVGRIKAPKIVEIGQRVRPCWATLYQKVDIFAILGAAFPPRAPIGVKFCTAKRTRNYTWISGTSRPCGAKMLVFGLWVNFIPVTPNLPLCGNPAGNYHVLGVLRVHCRSDAPLRSTHRVAVVANSSWCMRQALGTKDSPDLLIDRSALEAFFRRTAQSRFVPSSLPIIMYLI